MNSSLAWVTDTWFPEMLETTFFRIFWGSMPPYPLVTHALSDRKVPCNTKNMSHPALSRTCLLLNKTVEIPVVVHWNHAFCSPNNLLVMLSIHGYFYMLDGFPLDSLHWGCLADGLFFFWKKLWHLITTSTCTCKSQLTKSVLWSCETLVIHRFGLSWSYSCVSNFLHVHIHNEWKCP